MKLNWQKIKNTTWYEQKTNSMPTYVMNAGNGVLKLLNAGTQVFFFLDKKNFRAFYDEKFLYKTANLEFNNYLKKPKKFYEKFSAWVKQTKKLENRINVIRNSSLNNFTTKDLILLNTSFAKEVEKFWKLKPFLDIFDTSGEKIVEQRLHNKKHLPQNIKNKLLTPSELSEKQKFEISILKHLLKKKPSVKELLNKFYFINCSYFEGRALSENRLKEEINLIRKTGNLKTKLKTLNSFQTKIKRFKIKTYQEYYLNNLQKRTFSFFAFLAAWRDKRKSLTQKIINAQYILANELAIRSNLKVQEILLLNPLEIKKIPLSKKAIKEAILHLQTKNLYYQYNNKTIFLSKPVGKKLLKLLENSNPKTQQVYGQPANLGNVKGRIKIIHGEADFFKFLPNEVLVTSMTRPEFLPLMKKAKAIITDEGGITSHAAIVSRELGIPCIIGTKIATKVFKDGDMVEVDANKGIVRKIK